MNRSRFLEEKFKVEIVLITPALQPAQKRKVLSDFHFSCRLPKQSAITLDIIFQKRNISCFISNSDKLFSRSITQCYFLLSHHKQFRSLPIRTIDFTDINPRNQTRHINV